MSDPNDFSIDAQVKRINTEYGRRQMRFAIVFSVVSAAVLAGTVALIFLFDLIHQSMGIWILLAIVIVVYGGMWLGMRSLGRARRRAIREAGGDVP